MSLSPIEQKFILHRGEMGTLWGIKRTVAQVHALLFLSPQPLHAEETGSEVGLCLALGKGQKFLDSWLLGKKSG